MRQPNLNTLRMFDAAARQLNFRLAAEELHLTQGAVAQKIRKLEADLGLQLFERQARGLALTEAGRTLHPPVAKALGIIHEALQNLQPEPGRVTLSVTPSLATKWLVPRLGRFAEQHPEIDLRIQATERTADFKTDGVDLAIRLGEGRFGAGLSSALLSRLDLCAVASPDCAEGIATRSLAEFAQQRLIQDGHNHWQTLLQNEGIKPRHRMLQFNQTALAMDAAILGQGIALAPWLLVAGDVAQARLTVLWRHARGDEGFYLVRPNRQKPNKARLAVEDWIRAQIT